MDGADASGMAGTPGFQEIEGFGAAHFSDRDAVGAQPKRRAHEFGQRRDAILGAHGDEVWRCALQLAGVLDDDDAVGRLRDFGEKGIGERGLAGGRTANDEDVGA
ncbi:hypothetical protein D9M70_574760 [compost metagenome]